MRGREEGGKRFSPPTPEMVRAYCDERGNGIDAERFVDFYSARGWMSGKTRIRDWKACVRTWEQRDVKGGDDDGKRDRLLAKYGD